MATRPGRDVVKSSPQSKIRKRMDTPSPSPPRENEDGLKEPRKRFDSSSSSGSDSGSDSSENDSKKKKKKTDKKTSKKELKKRLKKEKKRVKKEKKKEKKKAKKEISSGEGLSNELIVPFGDGGFVTYPIGFKGELITIKKKTRRDDDSDDDNKDNENQLNKKTKEEGEVSASTLLATGNALDFFAQLKQQEAEKGPVGTMHASGNKGDAVSGQGIMAGVRTSTKRPTGMGGGAIPHDQCQDGTGEWACLKCGKKNPKVAGSCSNCAALKRMSMYQ